MWKRSIREDEKLLEPIRINEGTNLSDGLVYNNLLLNYIFMGEKGFTYKNGGKVVCTVSRQDFTLEST